MATRSQGPCVNLRDDEYFDNSDADVFHHQKIDNVVEAWVKTISSIPPRRRTTSTPVMPPEIMESFLQPRSPPPSPTPVRIAQKGIKPLTSQEPSNQYSKESITSIASSLAPSSLTSWPLRVSQDTKPSTSRKSSKQSSEEPATSTPLLSPTSTPLASHIVPKDTKSLTSSKQSGKDPIASSALPFTTGLLTPPNTPPKAKAEVKLESSPSPEIETSRQVTELQSKPHVTTESNKEPATNIAPLPPAGLHTPVRKETRESNLSGETALDAEISATYHHEPNTGSQLSYLHKPASDTTPLTPITPKSVLRNGIAKRSSVQCKEEVPITPERLTNNPVHCPSYFSTRVGGALLTHVDHRQFKVERPGRKNVFVSFSDHIPPYLQPETQKKLRTAITKQLSGRDKVPGYVYALNVTDLEREGKLILKVGYSENVKRRHAQWKRQCPSYIEDIRGCWPSQQCPPGPMIAQVERLVHIELADLARHAPYLRPNFPYINYMDVPPLAKPERVFCRDCVNPRTGKGTEHREIFSFRRVEEGVILGREWEYIIEPVIRRWGLFVMKYFAELA